MIQTSLNRHIIDPPQSVNPVFARHETFHPRFGWLKKGFDKAKEDPGVFLAEDAPVRLGVGKNMVRSLRYWCQAFKILEGDRPTVFGENLLKDDGWDPFLEDPASLWLLHWNLLKPPCDAAAWHYTFNQFRRVEFSQNDLFLAVSDYGKTLKKNLADSSINKDVSCLLRMYVKQSRNHQVSEDSIDCPFAELGLITRAGDSKYYTFRVNQKRNLPPEIVVAACLEYAEFVGREQRTIALSRLLYDIGSPGMVFKLPESAVCDAIERVARQWKAIGLSEAAGLIQFYFTQNPQELADHLLGMYYNKRRVD
ncbi:MULTISPECIES: DUF4007 family protein [unclassified Limnospira]|uniref:DUF4007 family protein n=1 Tax=unclassified Limnospira TaxID=2642885 RepID=UPI0028E0EDFC|nr:MULTISPECIES: DUF4007 family protein [unclassified Limnospira]MDT9192367.1 DUF4007 family protein [Limnospira sp. PMC 1245.20]MDT9202421.1 DUF4007 family protein [Limnospira sp. PMC 1243.20]MDT9207473.1 DUF4007 family protein [Limnospira sp. PMC 1252.20]MDT9253577.1 DUF4007 family protein [Limnospira sp. PMC 1254.20]MDT9258416.1 DUF4007 family protein [Limnospira sp. PMC 1236.20]